MQDTYRHSYNGIDEQELLCDLVCSAISIDLE